MGAQAERPHCISRRTFLGQLAAMLAALRLPIVGTVSTAALPRSAGAQFGEGLGFIGACIGLANAAGLFGRAPDALAAEADSLRRFLDRIEDEILSLTVSVAQLLDEILKLEDKVEAALTENTAREYRAEILAGVQKYREAQSAVNRHGADWESAEVKDQLLVSAEEIDRARRKMMSWESGVGPTGASVALTCYSFSLLVALRLNRSAAVIAGTIDEGFAKWFKEILDFEHDGSLAAQIPRVAKKLEDQTSELYKGAKGEEPPTRLYRAAQLFEKSERGFFTQSPVSLLLSHCVRFIAPASHHPLASLSRGIYERFILLEEVATDPVITIRFTEVDTLGPDELLERGFLTLRPVVPSKRGVCAESKMQRPRASLADMTPEEFWEPTSVEERYRLDLSQAQNRLALETAQTETQIKSINALRTQLAGYVLIEAGVMRAQQQASLWLQHNG